MSVSHGIVTLKINLSHDQAEILHDKIKWELVSIKILGWAASNLHHNRALKLTKRMRDDWWWFLLPFFFERIFVETVRLLVSHSQIGCRSFFSLQKFCAEESFLHNFFVKIKEKFLGNLFFYLYVFFLNFVFIFIVWHFLCKYLYYLSIIWVWFRQT